MRRALTVCCLALIVLGGCAEEGESYLDVDYSDWERTVDRDLTLVVPGHGGGLRRIYINPIGTDAAPAEDGSVRYPEGTILLKESYTVPDPASDEEAQNILGMVKDPDNPDSRGGWVWVIRTRATGDETVFAEEYCITCHGNANETHPYGDGNPGDVFRDYVFYPYEDDVSGGERLSGGDR